MAVSTPPQSTQAAFYPDSAAGGVPARQGGFHAALFILPAPHDATATQLMHPQGHQGTGPDGCQSRLLQ